jgi:hypothetical protein
MAGPLSFQEDYALPTLQEAVQALKELGIEEYDRATSTLNPPPAIFETRGPVMDIFGISPLVAILIFLGGTFSEWSMSKIYDTAWNSVKETFQSLLRRRASDPTALDRSLTLRFEFWLDGDADMVGVRVEIPAGDDGTVLLDRIPNVLGQLAEGERSDAHANRVVTVSTEQ